jgi:hypothetical protein
LKYDFDVQETLATVAKFMDLTETADLSPLMEDNDGGHRSPTIADFMSAKQDLYNAIGDLVIASEEITYEEKDAENKSDSTDPPKSRKRKGTEGVRNVIKAGESLKVKVHSVCLNMSFMVEEDKSRRRKTSGNDSTPISLISSGTSSRYGSKKGIANDQFFKPGSWFSSEITRS